MLLMMIMMTMAMMPTMMTMIMLMLMLMMMMRKIMTASVTERSARAAPWPKCILLYCGNDMFRQVWHNAADRGQEACGATAVVVVDACLSLPHGKDKLQQTAI